MKQPFKVGTRAGYHTQIKQIILYGMCVLWDKMMSLVAIRRTYPYNKTNKTIFEQPPYERITY